MNSNNAWIYGFPPDDGADDDVHSVGFSGFHDAIDRPRHYFPSDGAVAADIEAAVGVADSTDSNETHRNHLVSPTSVLELRVTEITPLSAADNSLYELYRYLGRIWILDARTIFKIGRNAATCEISLAADTTMSAEHAKISYENREFVVRDNSSKNGTTVWLPFSDDLYDTNDLQSNEAVTLRDGALIFCGVVTLKVRILSNEVIAGADILQNVVEENNVRRLKNIFDSSNADVERWMSGLPIFEIDQDPYFLLQSRNQNVGLEDRAVHRLPPLWYPLHAAVASGKKNMLIALLHEPKTCNVNLLAYPEGISCLHLAAQDGSIELTNILLAHGADVNTRDFFGNKSALDYVDPNNYRLHELLSSAVRLGYHARTGCLAKMKEILLEYPALLNARCGEGRTPLAIAALHGHNYVVQWLLNQYKTLDIDTRATMTGEVFDLRTNPAGDVTVETLNMTLGNTALHDACIKNYEKVVSSLLKKGADIHAVNDAGLTPLDFVHNTKILVAFKRIVPKAFAEIPGWLQAQCNALSFNRGARNLLEPSFWSLTSKKHAIHLAALFGHEKVIKGLLDDSSLMTQHAIINIPTETNGYTPLHFAANSGHLSVVSLLLSNSADPGKRDKKGKLPLDLAEKRLKEIQWQAEFRSRSSRFKDSRKDEQNTWDAAIARFEAIQNLLERPETKLRRAVARGNGDEVLTLVRNLEVNLSMLESCEVQCGTLIHWALGCHHTSLAELLIKFGLNPNGIDPTAELRTPLHIVAMSGSVELMDTLVSHGADVDARDALLQTPLHFAARSGNRRAVSRLLKHGADRELRDIEENRPFEVSEVVDIQYSLAEGHELLALAVVNEEESTIAQLLDQGICNINENCAKNKNAIHLAASVGSVHITRLLLEKNADINAQGGRYLWTPLHYAAFQGFGELAELLISRGANKRKLDVDGKTAYELAESSFMKEILMRTPAQVSFAMDSEGNASKETSDRVDIKDACKICMENVVNVIILPCGHQAFCSSCVGKLTDCALCRAPIKEVVKVYRA